MIVFIIAIVTNFIKFIIIFISIMNLIIINQHQKEVIDLYLIIKY